MTLKSNIATWAGKSSAWVLKNFLNRGSSLPGKITTKIDPEILSELGRNYEVILVTGTNGKTLTTALIVQVLKEKFENILTNKTGSNMMQGIVSTFLQTQPSKNSKKNQKPLAVLEVDEANVPLIAKYLHPKVFVLTNIFRDQLDRYGEIYNTYQKIIDGIKICPKATIIANGDTAIFNSIKLPNKQIFYGFKLENEKKHQGFKAPANTDGVLCPICQHILHYNFITYGNLGDYFCPHCGFKRPFLTYYVNKIIKQTPKASTFEINSYPYQIDVGGTYNIYNALAAYSVGRYFSITPSQIAHAFEIMNKTQTFGRQETIHIDDKDVTLTLVKNPVGLNQVIESLSTESNPFTLIILLNANYADGIDTSWIWDGDFEKLNKLNIKQYITGGKRYKDITTRLQIAGIPKDKHKVEPNLNRIINEIKQAPTRKVYILATYTAMLQLRKLFQEKGYLKGGLK